MHTETARLSVLRDKLENELLKLGNISVNGSREHRLPNVTNLSFKETDGNSLLVGLNKDLAVSSGSACSSASPEPSYVLKALGVEDNLAHASLRFSLGRFTTEAEISYAIEHVSSLVVKSGSALRFQ